MKTFLKLIRWPNLLIVALTMGLMRYAIIEPALNKISVTMYALAGSATTMSLQTPWYDFVILVVATVLITAGGYVINDYFDIKTDLINRGQVIVGTRIPRRQAMMCRCRLLCFGKNRVYLVRSSVSDSFGITIFLFCKL
jgi:4-hydroxybenzoate polyprenyltransferase